MPRPRAKLSITPRLDPARYSRLERLARAENRTPTNFVETAVPRDLGAKEETSRAITMLVPSEAAALSPGPLQRGADESDDRYAERSALMDRLFAMRDSD